MNTVCGETSDKLISCSECLLSFHFQCCDMDEQLYNNLQLCDCKGLKWSWRCVFCSDKPILRPVQVEDLKSQLLDISLSIKSDLSKEIRKELTEFSTSI